MHELGPDQTDGVGGGFSIVKWGIGQIFGGALGYVYNAAMSGKIDYAGVAEQQGTYYNTVGA